MTSIHLSNIFGLPSGVEKIAYWRVFGQKLVSSCTAGMFSWEQAQSFHIIGGIPIQANGMQFLARIPNVPDDEELLPSLTAGVWMQRSWQRWQQWRIGQRLSRGKTAFAAGAGTQVPGPLRHPQSPQGRPAAPQRPHHRIYRRQQRVRPHLLEDRYAGADAGAVPAHRRRPNIRGQVCDPERLPIRHRLRAAAPHQSPPFWQALIFLRKFSKRP